MWKRLSGNKQWSVKWDSVFTFQYFHSCSPSFGRTGLQESCPSLQHPSSPQALELHLASSRQPKPLGINHLDANTSNQLVIQNASSCNKSQTARVCQLLEVSQSKAARGQTEKENKPPSLKVSTREATLQITAWPSVSTKTKTFCHLAVPANLFHQ